MSTDTVFSVGSEDCRFVCCILPTAFVTVLSWVERKWNVSVILVDYPETKKNCLLLPVPCCTHMPLWKGCPACLLVPCVAQSVTGFFCDAYCDASSQQGGGGGGRDTHPPN